MEIAVALIVVVLSAASMFQLNRLIARVNTILSDDYLSARAGYQIALLILADHIISDLFSKPAVLADISLC